MIKLKGPWGGVGGLSVVSVVPGHAKLGHSRSRL